MDRTGSLQRIRDFDPGGRRAEGWDTSIDAEADGRPMIGHDDAGQVKPKVARWRLPGCVT